MHKFALDSIWSLYNALLFIQGNPHLVGLWVGSLLCLTYAKISSVKCFITYVLALHNGCPTRSTINDVRKPIKQLIQGNKFSYPWWHSHICAIVIFPSNAKCKHHDWQPQQQLLHLFEVQHFPKEWFDFHVNKIRLMSWDMYSKINVGKNIVMRYHRWLINGYVNW